jgi:hypothetical protein
LQANDFSISAKEISNLAAGTKLILKDKLLAKEIELTPEIVYNFNSPISTASTDRFSLLFRASSNTTEMKNTRQFSSLLYLNAENQIVVNSTENVNIAIYNVTGQKQYENKFTSTKTTINKTFGSGVYFVELSFGNQSEVQKIIIH